MQVEKARSYPSDNQQFASKELASGRIQPQALDLEEAVLGAMLIDERAPGQVVDILTKDSFYKENNLVADIHPLTYELRYGIIEAKAEQKNIKLTSDVLEFLANKITNNVREMEGALNRLAVHASLQESEITVDLVKDVLKDLLRTNSRKITIDEIQKKVVEHYNIKLSDMHSPRRSRSVARRCRSAGSSSYRAYRCAPAHSDLLSRQQAASDLCLKTRL